MVTLEQLLARREELLDTLEEAQTRAEWELAFEAFLTVCEVLDRQSRQGAGSQQALPR